MYVYDANLVAKIRGITIQKEEKNYFFEISRKGCFILRNVQINWIEIIKVEDPQYFI